MKTLTSIEICAGAGGQALGLEQAGFNHSVLVELDPAACQTLRFNRPNWRIVEGDLKEFSGVPYRGVDLLAGGVPCPPFSVAGRQLGRDDERDLFPEALRLVEEAEPRAVMLENVRGLLGGAFDEYRASMLSKLDQLGYTGEWRLLNASDFGVPQLRPRAILVAVRKDLPDSFSWPEHGESPVSTVGECISDLLGERGWRGVGEWKLGANKTAPTLVGGSKKHGGPDLGPTRAKKAWAELGVNGHGLADKAPDPDFEGMPKLTLRMAARIQGFPDTWSFAGNKTAVYRQIGNAFPPPVAKAVGLRIFQCLQATSTKRRRIA